MKKRAGKPYFYVTAGRANRSPISTHRLRSVADKKARQHGGCVYKAVPRWNKEHGWEDTNTRVACYSRR
jgi:hypothetical protein